MDVVYIVRPGDNNNELRHSLRSVAANLTHDNLWIVGHRPEWVDAAESVQTIQGAGLKHENSTRNVLTACNVSTISDPFILMMDDVYIITPVTEIPTLHRGPMKDVLHAYERKFHRGGSPYVAGMRDTYEWLKTNGYPRPISYELHVPLVVDKAGMKRAIQAGIGAALKVPHKRSIYGNLEHIGGAQSQDCKVHTSAPHHLPGPFASSMDSSFGRGWIGSHIRAMFPDPCQYERT